MAFNNLLFKLAVLYTLIVSTNGAVYSVTSSSKYYTARGTSSVRNPPTVTSARSYTWPIYQTCYSTPTTTVTKPASTLTVTSTTAIVVTSTCKQYSATATSTQVLSTVSIATAPTSTATSLVVSTSIVTVAGGTVTVSTSAGFSPAGSTIPTAPAPVGRRSRRRQAGDAADTADLEVRELKHALRAAASSPQYVQSYVRYNWYWTYTLQPTTIKGTKTATITKTAPATITTTKTNTIVSSVCPTRASTTVIITLTQVSVSTSTPVTTTISVSTEVDTVSLPASTYYAACGPDNTVGQTPDGLTIVNFQPDPQKLFAAASTTDPTPYDCCVSCINESICAIAAFYSSGAVGEQCGQYIDATGVCTEGGDSFSVTATSSNFPPAYVSNGNCAFFDRVQNADTGATY